MNTRETLILKALQFKAVHTNSASTPIGSALLDHFLEQNPDQSDAITKNVCARLSLDLVNRMDQIGEVLSLSKRQIIEMAVIDFLDQADATMMEFDVWPDPTEADYSRALDANE